jgi:hypothetical protein
MFKYTKGIQTKLEKGLAKYCKSIGINSDDVEFYGDSENAEFYKWNCEYDNVRFTIIYSKKDKKVL